MSTARTEHEAPCPCGSGSALAACCGRIHAAFTHDGALTAPTAEALMRARFSAFARLGAAEVAHDGGARLARAMVAYLRATWVPETRPAVEDLMPTSADPAPRFTRLAVLDLGGVGPDAAEVEFVAVGQGEGGRFRLHERSRFRRDAGAWLYVDGQMR
ncbi:YchJ family metal-binding protein [Micrococcus sp. M4NT]|uniref:YchJ family protein n=1 Tax=Micrococcus sp. M4NT TaxID=2957501 RepID=UPI0029BE0479|nr:YchJ family metal-binding protein [Micrococcus sp. M4NT]MDX2341395.1 YchJ family metal-binding protein [Micrococcus sp. M4NT]